MPLLAAGLGWTRVDDTGEIEIFHDVRTKTIAERRSIDVDPALILWSSGSTRTPRGIVLQHAGLMATIRANIRALDLIDGDRTLVVLPVAHAYGLIHQCLCHLAIGATIYLPKVPVMASALCKDIEELRITTMAAVPTLLAILLKGRQVTRRACPTLRLLTIGAGGTDPLVIQQAAEAFPNTELALTYGLTEAGPRVSTHFVGRGKASPQKYDAVGGCIGLPLPNIEVTLRPNGGRDEICVRGSSVMRSYAAEPYREGKDRLIGTGDWGEIWDEKLFYRGRRDRAINRGGVLVSPETIESVLKQHPSIMTARVRREKHQFWGEVPVAVISFKRGIPKPSLDEIKRFCSERLDEAEIPSDITVERQEDGVPSKERDMLSLFAAGLL